MSARFAGSAQSDWVGGVPLERIRVGVLDRERQRAEVAAARTPLPGRPAQAPLSDRQAFRILVYSAILGADLLLVAIGAVALTNYCTAHPNHLVHALFVITLLATFVLAARLTRQWR